MTPIGLIRSTIVFGLLLFYACKKNSYELLVVFNDVEGLQTSSKVVANGVEIGKVKTLEIWNSNKVMATAVIDLKVKIPINSSFTIKADGILGPKVISIRLDSSSVIYYQNQDTIYGQQYNVHSMDSASLVVLKPAMDTLASAIELIVKSFQGKQK